MCPATESQFESVLPELKAGLAGVAPFTVRFETFDYFEHGASSCTLFLKPTVQVRTCCGLACRA
jgi:hypothetical protein